MDRFFIITGAFGSGKSTLLKALNQQSYRTVSEPARDILKEQREIDGLGVPDKDPYLFAQLLLSRAIEKYQQMSHMDGKVIFDRGMPDTIAYASFFNLDTHPFENAAKIYSYAKQVFWLPPWEEIYTTDEERTLSFGQSVQFSDLLKNTYAQLGYELVVLPKSDIACRVQFVIDRIEGSI